MSGVYHFTSIDAFKNIIESKSLWMTPLEFAYEQHELEYTKEHFIETCKEKLEDDLGRLLIDSLNKHEEEFDMECDKKQHIYSISFSNETGKEQWEHFKNKSYQIAIKINIDEVNKIKQNILKIIDINLLNIADAIYQGDEKENSMIEEVISNQYFKTLLRKEYINTDDMIIKEYIENYGFLNLFKAFNEIRYRYKPNEFSKEKEKRIVLIEESFEQFNRILKANLYENERYETLATIKENFEQYIKRSKINERYFHVFNLKKNINVLKSYHVLSLAEVWGSALIPEIVIDDSLDVETHKEEIKLFLADNGLLNTKIITSTEAINASLNKRS